MFFIITHPSLTSLLLFWATLTLPTQAAQALAGAGDNKASGGPNTVLRVIVEHMVYPVTLDVIFQIFSRVGKVMKIVTFTKNNTFQVRLIS